MKKFKKVARDEGTDGFLNVEDLPILCDKIGLNLLMISDQMHHYFKYIDCVNGTAQKYVDDGTGRIDYNK
jgi:hypothetical protein